jgi:CubicO group peptidase (beta-lactamase class C family)
MIKKGKMYGQVSEHRPKAACLIFLFCLLMAAFSACETQESITRKRIKSLEKGLLSAVYFKGQKLEKMSLATRMEFYRVPGVSIACLDKYQVEWAKAYGQYDVLKPDPLATDSLFQAGALSQPIATAAALHFVEKGRLNLDDDVNTWLHSWKFPQEELAAKKKLRLRGLLSHSSGLSNQVFPGYLQKDTLPSLRNILDGKKPANSLPIWYDFKPGSGARYSESGYVLLQQLLIDLENKPFPQIMKEIVLDPSGMKNSTFELPLPPDFSRRAASGHLRNGQPIEGRWLNYPELGANGLWTTPSDYAAFILEIVHAAMGDSAKIISAESARAMLAPQAENRGFGFLVEGSGDGLNFYLQGRTNGFSCYTIFYPAKGQGAVVMTNSENGPLLVEELLRALSATYEWPHFKPKEKQLYRFAPSAYQQYVGRYEVTPDYVLDVGYEDYYLVVQPTGQVPTKFYVESETIFFSVDPYIRIQFRKDEQGKVLELVLWQQDFQQVAKKIS